MIRLLQGDCLERMAELPDNSVDSIVTDPPYELGFMGKHWDGTGIAYNVETWRHCLRVLKPGGHLVAFSGSRTYHRMVCAIEDAGFEIRDQIMWLYGSGFPKSHDVAKDLDKRAGHWRGRAGEVVSENGAMSAPNYERTDKGDPITDAARQWQGWGTALKPAHEPIVLARKPLEGTVAANVLKHGTGALNVDGCRVGVDGGMGKVAQQLANKQSEGGWGTRKFVVDDTVRGRFPANVIHDGSDEVVGAFPETKAGVAVQRNGGGQKIGGNGIYGGSAGLTREDVGFGDSGSAARFFYTAKADDHDRLGTKHPTVKPLDLMQYLVRLVTPKGGTVLDPFAGSGTTGEAAFREGMKAVLIEREAEYCACIERRIAHLESGPVQRRHATIKAKGKVEDAGPLFGGSHD